MDDLECYVVLKQSKAPISRYLEIFVILYPKPFAFLLI